MKKMKRVILQVLLSGVLLLAGCTGKEPKTPTVTGPAATEPAKGNEVDHIGGKEIIVYFPNWNLGKKNGNVEDIPWESITMVNHAFWEVVPLGDETESSFERRSAGKEARKNFAVASTSAKADEEIFKKYRDYHATYPDVKIMISVGGWTRCGFFSEMAYTAEGRESFVRSCVDLIKDNDWIAGIDIDWEYPGGSNDGERKPEGGGDQGCPIFGTDKEDSENFTKLLKELKEALNKEFGEGKKLVTACASSSTGWTLPHQDWKSASAYVDYINIMTYDMSGEWEKKAGHASSVSGTKNAIAYFLLKDVDAKKLNIGIPYYGTGFKLAKESKVPAGSNIVIPGKIDQSILTVAKLTEFEQEAVPVEEKGWHKGLDEHAGGAYLWNDDETSKYYLWYISYETRDTMDAKFALIEKYSLAGVLVWEITEDTAGHDYTKHLAEILK